MKNIYICSPLNAETDFKKEANRKKALEYMKYCKEFLQVNGRAPHAYLSLLLNDDIPSERNLALKFGLDLLSLCTDIYVCGCVISPGMKAEIIEAVNTNLAIWVFNPCLYGEIQLIINAINPEVVVYFTEDKVLASGYRYINVA